MTVSSKVTLCGLAAALALAFALGGRDGAGVFAGFTAGAALALGSALAQRRIAAARPELVLHLIGAGFLAKIFLLLALALLLRFVPALAAAIDLRAFVLAFAAAIFALLPVTTIEFLRLVDPRAKSAGAERAEASRSALEQGTSS